MTPFFPKSPSGWSGFRVQPDELIANAHVKDALVAPAIGPVAHAAARQDARRFTCALVQTMHPHQLASRRVDGNGIAVGAGREIQDAVDHQRRRLQVVIRILAERLALESPRHFEGAEVVGVNLVERRVAGRGEVAGPGPPFAVSCTRLRRDRDDAGERDRDQRRQPPHHRSKHRPPVTRQCSTATFFPDIRLLDCDHGYGH